MTPDLDRILATLARHEVRYVMIGGLAAAAHGSTLPTEDIDVVPARDRRNLDRLAAALEELGARIRAEGEPNGVELPRSGAFLAAMGAMLNLTTDAGDVDLVLQPAGFADGHDALDARAIDVDLDLDVGVVVRVASLADIIASKRAANRPKDVAALPYLEALADEIARGR
jgi:hypothetical protein